MTYLSEEIHPSFVAFSMGLYISGNSIGGMSGRLISGVFTDFFNWRIALAAIGCFALASALMFWKILPESRHFRPTSLRPKTLFINFRLHWRDRGLPLLFAEGFLLMGSFVTLFNYIGYRLMLSSVGTQPGGCRPVVRGLSDRDLELTESGVDDHPLWPWSGNALFNRCDAGWTC
ncbi:major facilitator superfamily protein [Citrobacter freundii]|nr:major facilitator superfamily protein [Citrobacter freundii]